MKRIRNGLLVILAAVLAFPVPTYAADMPATAATAPAASAVSANIPPAASVAPATAPPITQPSATPPSSSVVSGDVSSPGVAEPSASVTPAPALPLTPAAPPAANNAKIVISKIGTAPADKKFVELYNPTDQAVDLEGWKLEYIAKSGKTKTLLKRFVAGNKLEAHELLVIGAVEGSRVMFDAKSPRLAKDGGSVRLLRADESAADVVGWGKDTAIHEGHPAKAGELLWRCFANGAAIDSSNNADDILHASHDGAGELVTPGMRPQCPQAVDPGGEGSETDPGEAGEAPPTNACKGLRFSEIAANVDRQFIEVMNGGPETIGVDGCKLVTNRSKTKSYVFGNLELRPGEFQTVYIADTDLLLTKTGRGSVYLLDAGGREIDSVEYEPMKSSTAMILHDGEWLATYAVTPDAANVWQEFPSCQSGYVRNELTGRCVKVVVADELPPCEPGQYRNPATGRCKKIETAKELAPCKEGYYRSEETGRCRSIASAAAQTLKPCADGYFRNPETGRCKKIAAASDITKECPEGFERNPATNRCRKIKDTTPPKAEFAPEPVKQVAGAMWGWWVAGGIGILAVGYAAWEWRWELRRLLHLGK